ncbi:MAG TPA: polysaccharide biosynthesis protein [Clostridiales bacterium]|nr:polysaccharide biosynthesis protein [Clostridiales bacterium]
MQALIRRLTLVILDVFLVTLSLYLAIATKFGFQLTNYYLNEWLIIWGTLTVASLACNMFFNLYRSLWRYAGINELLYILSSGIVTGIIYFLLMHLINIRIAYSVYFLVVVYNTFFLGMSRLGYRIMWMISSLAPIGLDKGAKRALIIGAGHTGIMVINELRRHPEMGIIPVALLDDDRLKHGLFISGVKVYGGTDKIREIVRRLDIDEIILAIPSAPKKKQSAILNESKKIKCKLKIVPSIYKLINEEVSIKHIRDVQIEDLLGREQITLNIDNICGYISNQVVLVTGGGGSIGSELCRQIARFNPKQLLILDFYENNAYDLQQELKRHFPGLNQKVLIASIRDRARMESVFITYRPAVVFHAAAHKHVPLMEENPQEAVKNNVFGTLNVAECADKYGARKFVLISTDKAVNPTNVMGATKRIAEMIIQGMNKKSRTEYVAVRFGNVLGSNGSVIPLFKKQIAEGGPVTVTHPEINRFFMTIPEAVQLVLEAGSMAKGGEIFVLDMGQPVKIADLARDLIRLSGLEPDVDIEIKYTGLRPGEKLYEELLMAEEGLTATRHEKIHIGRPLDIDMDELYKELEKLKFVLTGPEESLIEFIKEMVPTYKSNDEVAVVRGQQ